MVTEQRRTSAKKWNKLYFWNEVEKTRRKKTHSREEKIKSSRVINFHLKFNEQTDWKSTLPSSSARSLTHHTQFKWLKIDGKNVWIWQWQWCVSCYAGPGRVSETQSEVCVCGTLHSRKLVPRRTTVSLSHDKVCRGGSNVHGLGWDCLRQKVPISRRCQSKRRTTGLHTVGWEINEHTVTHNERQICATQSGTVNRQQDAFFLRCDFLSGKHTQTRPKWTLCRMRQSEVNQIENTRVS